MKLSRLYLIIFFALVTLPALSSAPSDEAWDKWKVSYVKKRDRGTDLLKISISKAVPSKARE